MVTLVVVVIDQRLNLLFKIIPVKSRVPAVFGSLASGASVRSCLGSEDDTAHRQHDSCRCRYASQQARRIRSWIHYRRAASVSAQARPDTTSDTGCFCNLAEIRLKLIYPDKQRF